MKAVSIWNWAERLGARLSIWAHITTNGLQLDDKHELHLSALLKLIKVNQTGDQNNLATTVKPSNTNPDVATIIRSVRINVMTVSSGTKQSSVSYNLLDLVWKIPLTKLWTITSDLLKNKPFFMKIIIIKKTLRKRIDRKFKRLFVTVRDIYERSLSGLFTNIFFRDIAASSFTLKLM